MKRKQFSGEQIIATLKEDQLRTIASAIEGPHLMMIWTPLTLPVAELYRMGFQLLVDSSARCLLPTSR